MQIQRTPIRDQRVKSVYQTRPVRQILYNGQSAKGINQPVAQLPQKCKLFYSKLEKIKRQLQQQQRQYQKRLNPFTYKPFQSQSQSKFKNYHQRFTGHYQAGKRVKTQTEDRTVKTEQNYFKSGKMKTQQTIQSPTQLDQSQYKFQSNLSSLSNSKVKFSTRKKTIYLPSQKQIIYYPLEFRNQIQARQKSLIPLAKKGLVIKYDAQYKPMKSDLIYQFASKDSEKVNPFINYRQTSQSRPLNNYSQNPELLKFNVDKKYKENILSSYKQSFQKKTSASSQKSDNSNRNSDAKLNQPQSPIRTLKRFTLGLKAVLQQAHHLDQSRENTQRELVLDKQQQALIQQNYINS